MKKDLTISLCNHCFTPSHKGKEVDMVDSIKKEYKLTCKSGATQTAVSLQQMVSEASISFQGKSIKSQRFIICLFSRGWYLTCWQSSRFSSLRCTRSLPASNSHLALTLEQSFLKNFRKYLRPTSDAVFTLKQTSCDKGQKRWNEDTVHSDKMALDLSKSVEKSLRYRRFNTGP